MTVGKVGALLGGVLLVGMVGAFAFGLPAGGDSVLDAGGFAMQAPSLFDVQAEGGYVLLAPPEKVLVSEALLADKLQESLMESLTQSHGSCRGLGGL